MYWFQRLLAPETDPGTVRLRNIESTSFEIRFPETNHLSQDHAAEQVSYLVAESGEWQLNDGTKIQVGKVNSNKLSSKGFETVSFSESFTAGDAVNPIGTGVDVATGVVADMPAYGNTLTMSGGVAGSLAGTITSAGVTTLTAGGAGTTATGQFVTEIVID